MTRSSVLVREVSIVKRGVLLRDALYTTTNNALIYVEYFLNDDRLDRPESIT